MSESVVWRHTRLSVELLRCDLCGEQADTIHICNLPDHPEVLFACPVHDPGGYWFEVERWLAEEADWISHLSEKDWGPEALAQLAKRLDEARVIAEEES